MSESTSNCSSPIFSDTLPGYGQKNGGLFSPWEAEIPPHCSRSGSSPMSTLRKAALFAADLFPATPENSLRERRTVLAVPSTSSATIASSKSLRCATDLFPETSESPLRKRRKVIATATTSRVTIASLLNPSTSPVLPPAVLQSASPNASQPASLQSAVLNVLPPAAPQPAAPNASQAAVQQPEDPNELEPVVVGPEDLKEIELTFPKRTRCLISWTHPLLIKAFNFAIAMTKDSHGVTTPSRIKNCLENVCKFPKNFLPYESIKYHYNTQTRPLNSSGFSNSALRLEEACEYIKKHHRLTPELLSELQRQCWQPHQTKPDAPPRFDWVRSPLAQAAFSFAKYHTMDGNGKTTTSLIRNFLSTYCGIPETLIPLESIKSRLQYSYKTSLPADQFPWEFTPLEFSYNSLITK